MSPTYVFMFVCMYVLIYILYICLLVCLYACRYVRIVCMYECMCICAYVCRYLFMCICMYVWMCEWTRTYIRTYRCIYTCMCVRTYMQGLYLRSSSTHTATHCDTLQHTVIRCNTLQHTTSHCNTPAPHQWSSAAPVYACWNTHTATHMHCNTVQHSATHTHHNPLQHTCSASVIFCCASLCIFECFSLVFKASFLITSTLFSSSEHCNNNKQHTSQERISSAIKNSSHHTFHRTTPYHNILINIDEIPWFMVIDYTIYCDFIGLCLIIIFWFMFLHGISRFELTHHTIYTDFIALLRIIMSWFILIDGIPWFILIDYIIYWLHCTTFNNEQCNPDFMALLFIAHLLIITSTSWFILIDGIPWFILIDYTIYWLHCTTFNNEQCNPDFIALLLIAQLLIMKS